MIKRIITHSGVFHADEVFAIAALRLIEDTEFPVLRTRDPQELSESKADPETVVVDVGSVYDPSLNNFDHHQREGAPEPRANGVPYSSFGLIWKHFGTTYCSKRVADKVDFLLVQKVDALDCGYGGRVEQVTISDFISWHNTEEADLINECFEEALLVARKALTLCIERAYRQVDNETAIEDAIAASYKEPRLIVMDKFMPGWQEPIITNAPEALYVVFPDISGDWRIQCVPDAVGSFGTRKALPETWVDGKPFDDFVFCHKGRFIAGAKSKETILKMAQVAIDHILTDETTPF